MSSTPAWSCHVRVRLSPHPLYSHLQPCEDPGAVQGVPGDGPGDGEGEIGFACLCVCVSMDVVCLEATSTSTPPHLRLRGPCPFRSVILARSHTPQSPRSIIQRINTWQAGLIDEMVGDAMDAVDVSTHLSVSFIYLHVFSWLFSRLSISVKGLRSRRRCFGVMPRTE